MFLVTARAVQSQMNLKPVIDCLVRVVVKNVNLVTGPLNRKEGAWKTVFLSRGISHLSSEERHGSVVAVETDATLVKNLLVFITA
jgi:hypothetical protein